MMKKIFIISALAIAFSFNASAQQGSFYMGLSKINFLSKSKEVNKLGLGTGVISVSHGEDRGTSYGIAPEFGYYVSDRVVVGGVIGLSGYSLKNNNSDGFNFGLSPYVRYFLYKNENFGFYLQGGVDFLQQKSDETKLTSWGVGILPGVSYALSSHFGLAASFGQLGYASQKYKGAKDATNTFGLNLDASTLNFSLCYTF